VEDVKRISISIPDSLDGRLLELRKTDRFVRCSYAEIVRQVLALGINELETGSKLDSA